jgi:RNA polymerase sigma factor (TIGR02999 family)
LAVRGTPCARRARTERARRAPFFATGRGTARGHGYNRHVPPKDEKRARARPGAEPPAAAQTLTRILQDISAGRAKASDELLPLVYDELRLLARQRLREERVNHTLNATALVHEAYLRLAGGDKVAWENRAHFFGAAARAMRRVLIDHARKRNRLKRASEHRQVPLSVVDLMVDADRDEILAIDAAVEKLAARDARMAEIVHLRFYAGLSVEEVAAALGLSDRTVRREWSVARAWLSRELGE